MLARHHLDHVKKLLIENARPTVLRDEVEKIRTTMNPHPAKQKEVHIDQSILLILWMIFSCMEYIGKLNRGGIDNILSLAY